MGDEEGVVRDEVYGLWMLRSILPIAFGVVAIVASAIVLSAGYLEEPAPIVVNEALSMERNASLGDALKAHEKLLVVYPQELAGFDQNGRPIDCITYSQKADEKLWDWQAMLCFPEDLDKGGPGDPGSS